MSDATPKSQCPECHAPRITAAEGPCWMCGTPLPATQDVATSKGPVEESGFLIFLGFTFTFILCGLMADTPGLAILVGILLVPVFARAIVLSRRREAVGHQLTWLHRVGFFFSSLGLVIFGALAAFLAFFVTCSAVCFGLYGLSGSNRRGGDWIFPASMFVGLGPGLLLFGYLMWRFWPRKK